MIMFTTALANAQDATMADGLRSEGKIYVVVLIILMVLAGLIVYLFLMDRKLNRLEKILHEKNQTKR
jgi:hypothetical protein